MKKISYFAVMFIILFSVLGLNSVLAADKAEKKGTIQTTVDSDGVTTMVVSENDLEQFSEEMVNGPLQDYIKSASVKVFDGYVEVTAVTKKPFGATLFVSAEISAMNNKLYPKILKMKYGFFRIPNFLINFFIGKLVGQDAQNFQSTGVETPGLEWHSVDLKNGEITIEFKEVK